MVDIDSNTAQNWTLLTAVSRHAPTQLWRRWIIPALYWALALLKKISNSKPENFQILCFRHWKTNTSHGGEDEPFHVTPRIAFEQVKQV